MYSHDEQPVLNRKDQGATFAQVVATAATFKRFKDLPVELRLKIWRKSFPPSRQINIRPFAKVSVLQLGSPPLPTILYVNSESRTETRRHYTIIFRQKFFARLFYQHKDVLPPHIPYRNEVPLCFNASKDILYLPSSSMREDLLDWVNYLAQEIPGGLTTVRNLHVNELDTKHLNRRYENTSRHFSIMKKFLASSEELEELTLTFPDQTGNFRQLLRSNQAFKDMVNWATEGGIAPGQDWAHYLGFRQSPPKLTTFRPFRPVTTYTHGNQQLDIWNSME